MSLDLKKINCSLEFDIKNLESRVIEKDKLIKNKITIGAKKYIIEKSLEYVSESYNLIYDICDSKDGEEIKKTIDGNKKKIEGHLKKIKYLNLQKIIENNKKITSLRKEIQKNDETIKKEINPWVNKMIENFSNYGGHTNFQCQICLESLSIIPCRLKLYCCLIGVDNKRHCDYIVCTGCIKKHIGISKINYSETPLEEKNRLIKPVKCLICRDMYNFSTKSKFNCYYEDYHLIRCFDSFFKKTLLPQAKQKFGFEPKLHKCKKCLKSFKLLSELICHIRNKCPNIFNTCRKCGFKHKKYFIHKCS